VYGHIQTASVSSRIHLTFQSSLKFNRRMVKEAQQYNIIGELYNLKQINKELVKQLSESIETRRVEKSKNRVKGSFEFLSSYANSSQLEVFILLTIAS
jgi:hypothetical protein